MFIFTLGSMRSIMALALDAGLLQWVWCSTPKRVEKIHLIQHRFISISRLVFCFFISNMVMSADLMFIVKTHRKSTFSLNA